MNYPQVRLQPWYPGQMGVPGSDVQRGLRWSADGIVLYVDENHPGTSGAADGTDPENPLNSIQTAITRLTTFATATNTSLEGSIIVVSAQATIAESVTIPATAPANCTLFGAGSSEHAPTWTPATAAGTALTIRAPGWRVTGFRFGWTGDGTGIVIDRSDAAGYEAVMTVIDNNRFWGAYNGMYAIDLQGAPSNCRILNNEFGEIRSVGAAGTAYAIISTDSTDANPYLTTIAGNTFWECENYIGSVGGARGFNLSYICNNMFHAGVLIPATIKLDMRGGTRGLNVVTGNYMGGQYTQAGGYYANAVTTDAYWTGNFALATIATVADNGLTVRVPA